MFVGRALELQTLEQFWSSDRFEFFVLYGRRRIGKTALINEFLQDRTAVYVTGVENDQAVNLTALSAAIAHTYPDLPSADAFSTFHSALEYLFHRSQTERVLLIIDEYPYMARADASLASTLQHLIDRYRDISHLKLILSGSSMSFMEDEVLAYKAPLFGRRTGQIRLKPFGFADSCRFVPRLSGEDKMTAYAVTGGIPAYLRALDDTMSMAGNLMRTFFNASSFLYEEPESLLRQELHEPAEYSAVLSAIAAGAVRTSEIMSRTGLASSVVSAYLRRLTELGLIMRRTPFGENVSHRALHDIADGAFRFWYRFVLPNVSLIERGLFERAYQKCEPHLPDFVSHAFEQVCMEYLWSLLASDRSPVSFSELGAWWGNDPYKKVQAEIDIVGTDENRILMGECKWRSRAVDTHVLRTLQSRVPILAHGREPYLYLFSKNGFTDGCRQEADTHANIALTDYQDILEELQIDAW